LPEAFVEDPTPMHDEADEHETAERTLDAAPLGVGDETISHP
jgi:hypothetical protein